MSIKTDDNLLKSANKAMRIAVVVYVLVKQITYMVMFESVDWIPRGQAGLVMLLIAFGVTQIKIIPKRHLSWIVPVAFSITEIVLVALIGGDRLTYTFLIGCALISLLYMDIMGLFITVTASCSVAALCLFVFGRTLIGDTYDYTSDMFNFLGLIVVDIVIFLIGKYGIGTLTRAKQSVEEALRDAQEANRAKSNFLATMSHEIRTPMNAILGIAQLQLHEENLPESYLTALNRITDSGNTLLSIINDILDMSKIEAGNMDLVPIAYDTPNLINDAVQLNIVRIGSNPIEFNLNIDEKLPSRLYGDELRLKQILNNLLSNAIKYTAKGEVKLTVSCSEIDGDRITLIFEVEDTGQGMKPEDCKKLFSHEYTRFNAEANRTTEGTGLGLSITKSLVEMMDGKISVESEYGTGSVFTVTVTQKVVNSTPIGEAVATSLHEFTYVDNKFKERRKMVRNPMPYGKVLVVDDVESNLYIVEGMLSQYKINTQAVNSGFKAIEKIEQGNTYDVIFMDHMMPRMDGIETTQKLREMGYDGIIVALTANALVGNEEMFRRNGFDGFIPKPIDVRVLDKILNTHIRGRYPEQAKLAEKVAPAGGEIVIDGVETPAVSAKLIQIFIDEAVRAAATLRETMASGDIKLYTTTAHGMKSALANVGKTQLSETARELESAGYKGDVSYINKKTEEFVKSLEELIIEMRASYAAEESAMTTEPANEDKTSLTGLLDDIIAACSEYDDKAVYAAIDKAAHLPCSANTATKLERIKDKLMLDSDFEEVSKLAGELVAELTE